MKNNDNWKQNGDKQKKGTGTQHQYCQSNRQISQTGNQSNKENGLFFKWQLETSGKLKITTTLCDFGLQKLNYPTYGFIQQKNQYFSCLCLDCQT